MTFRQLKKQTRFNFQHSNMLGISSEKKIILIQKLKKDHKNIFSRENVNIENNLYILKAAYSMSLLQVQYV